MVSQVVCISCFAHVLSDGAKVCKLGVTRSGKMILKFENFEVKKILWMD